MAVFSCPGLILHLPLPPAPRSLPLFPIFSELASAYPLSHIRGEADPPPSPQSGSKLPHSKALRAPPFSSELASRFALLPGEGFPPLNHTTTQLPPLFSSEPASAYPISHIRGVAAPPISSELASAYPIIRSEVALCELCGQTPLLTPIS